MLMPQFDTYWVHYAGQNPSEHIIVEQDQSKERYPLETAKPSRDYLKGLGQ